MIRVHTITTVLQASLPAAALALLQAAVIPAEEVKSDAPVVAVLPEEGNFKKDKL